MKFKGLQRVLAGLLILLLTLSLVPAVGAAEGDTKINGVSVLGTNRGTYTGAGPDYPISKMVDGINNNTSNFWNSQEYTTTCYVTFDLGKSYAVSKILVYARANNQTTLNRNIKDYDLYISDEAPVYTATDGTAPTGLPEAPVVSGTMAQCTPDNKYGTITLPAGSSGRYVTIYSKSIWSTTETPTDARASLNIQEVEFYGLATEDTPPYLSGFSIYGQNVADYNGGAGSFPATSLLDGISNNFGNNFWGTNTGSTEAYLTFDAGTVVELSEMRVYARPHANTYNRFVKDYEVFVSKQAPAYTDQNGTAPTGLGTATVSGTMNEATADAPSDTVSFPENTKGRYVTLHIKNIHGGTNIDLAEVEFFGIEDYWMGYDARLNVSASFGGARGVLELEGDKLPDFCYVQLDAFSATEKQFTETIIMRGGHAEYNIYDKKDGIVELRLRATADEVGSTLIAAEQQINVKNVPLPGVFITELSNQHTVTYHSDASGANYGTHEQKFQYIELFNYSDEDVDLSQYTFVYNDKLGAHAFEWEIEDEGSLILKSGQLYVIGVYGADSATEGYGYATNTQKQTYWEDFNTFYNCDVPVTNRVLIACVASGDATSKLDGITKLTRSSEAGVTCSAQIKKGNSVVTEVSLYENRPGTSIAFQFVPSDDGGVQEKFLATTGCFPGQLLKEQQVDYCEKVYLNGTPMLKVSSYNILATEKGAGGNLTGLEIEQREDLFVQYMRDYDIDIVGLQEVNYRWAPLLQEDMPAVGYTVVQGISSAGNTYSTCSGTWDLMNPIYYKTAKFEELERGHGFLTPSFPNDDTQWDSTNMKRTVTWVVLENKETGEVVSFLNTHLVLSGKQARVEQVKLMYKKGEELQKKYGGSIIIVGDHNLDENAEPYQEYINGGVVVDSKYETTNHNLIGSNSNGNMARDEIYSSTIDFVMVSKDYIVNKYYVYNGIVENGFLSDHAGIYVELYNSAYEDTDTPVITGVEDGKSYCEKAVFTVTDEYLVSVTLDGSAVSDPVNFEVVSEGAHILKVIEQSGRTTAVHFTLTKHDYVVTRTEPTCFEKGNVVTTCNNCDYYSCDEIAATGKHSWENEYTIDTPATCGVAGVKSIHCEYCDTAKTDSVTAIPATGKHTWDKGVVTKEPTTSKKGVKTYTCTVCSATKTEDIAKLSPKVSFTDVKKSDFYYDAVQWAVAIGVTTGTGKDTFSPEASCTRAQAVTFLWRAAGQPTAKNAKNPFTDVRSNDYFYKAVLWAAENGVTSGVSKTSFAPNATCTRGQIVTFLWRAQGAKKVTSSNPFTDVKKSDFYYDAVLWAVKNNVTAGMSKTTFAPSAKCTRGQIVTFLYRAVK